jgi:hypothetical protein
MSRPETISDVVERTGLACQEVVFRRGKSGAYRSFIYHIYTVKGAIRN